jgi:amino acid transporter
MSGQLLRVLGRRDVIALAFGAIIGWSWVLMTGVWVAQAGSLGAMIAFTVGGVAMILIGLTYAELASAMPQAGGEHVYSYRAFGAGVSFICTWALILAYVTVIAFEPVALGLAISYLEPAFTTGVLWNFAGETVWLSWVFVGCTGAAALTWINIRGVLPAAFLQSAVTAIILLAGVFFVTGTLSAGDTANLAPHFNAGARGMFFVLMMVPMMFIGFDVIPQAAEEIDLPRRHIGLLLVVSVCLALGWYLLMILGVALTFDVSSLEGKAMPTADASSMAWGNAWAGKVIVLGGIAGIISSWNAFLVAGSRVLFAMARDGLLPAWLADLHPRYNTPYKAVLLIGMFSFLAPLFGRQILVWCINAGGFAVVIAFGIVAASFLILRRREPTMERPYRVRYGKVVGWLALLMSCLLLLVYLPGTPAALVWPYEWGILIGWSALGLVMWLGRAKR